MTLLGLTAWHCYAETNGTKPSSLNLKYYFSPHQEYTEATGKGRAGRAGQTGRCLCDFTMVPSAPGG